MYCNTTDSETLLSTARSQWGLLVDLLVEVSGRDSWLPPIHYWAQSYS